MEILFESNTAQEQEFEYNGQTIVNKGNVQIIKAGEMIFNEATPV